MQVSKLFLGLYIFLQAATPAIGAITPTRDLCFRDENCAPVKYVVINSHEIAIYNSTIHGTGPTLRLFDKLPSGCSGNILASKTGKMVTLSTRTDLQLRDTRTDLSTFVYKRGFFSWARSLLKWIPFASTAAGVFDLIDCLVEWNDNSWAGKTACVLGGFFTVYGGVSLTMSTIANNLASGSSTADDILRVANIGFDTDQELYVISTRDVQTTVNFSSIQFEHFQHIKDRSNVTLAHLVGSNETHPLELIHHVQTLNQSVPMKLWPSWNNASSAPRLNAMTPLHWFSQNSTAKLRARQTCTGGGEAYYDGQLNICEYPTQQGIPNGAPTQIFYGVDVYGTKDEIIEYNDNLGITYSASNGQADALPDMATDIANDNAWDTCVCMMDNNNWISTGSLQMSWDNTYNDYSPC